MQFVRATGPTYTTEEYEDLLKIPDINCKKFVNSVVYHLKKSRSVRLENSEREELFTIYKKFRSWRTCSISSHRAPQAPGIGVKSEERVNGTRVVYHFKKIPVSSVGKFRTGRIVYHLQKIPIMENVFHFFTQSASGAWS